MKTKNPPRWYVEYDKTYRWYAVIKDEFKDSSHPNRMEALQRIVKLEEDEANES
jgi:hypothetical protein